MEANGTYFGTENPSTLEYTELPERERIAIQNFIPDDALVKERAQKFASIQPREPNRDGDTETLDGVVFTHHFMNVPGDYETVRFHFVECGMPDAEAIVFLHGIPDSRFQWHYQMAALAKAK